MLTDIGVLRGTRAILRSSSLASQLAGKANLVHTHPIGQILGLQTALNDTANWLNLANARNYGAVGNGVINDTNAFEAAYADVIAGDFAGVYAPPGLYVLTPGIIQIPTREGVSLIGAGCPSDTNTNPGISLGTMFRSDGTNPGFPLINIDGASGFTLKNFGLWGNPTNVLDGSSSNGLRLQNRGLSGLGSGVGLIERVAAFYCNTGFDIGSIDMGDTDHDDQNAADVAFFRCAASSCNDGFQINQYQNVNFGLYQCSVGESAIAVHVIRGGNVNASTFVTTDCDKLLVVDEGGNQVYHRFCGVHVDGLTKRTILYEATNADNADVCFENVVCNSGQLAVSGSPRLILKAGHQVRLKGGRNFANANGSLFLLDGGGCALIEFCPIPSTAAQVRDAASSGGSYRIRNCFDDVTSAFVADY